MPRASQFPLPKKSDVGFAAYRLFLHHHQKQRHGGDNNTGKEKKLDNQEKSAAWKKASEVEKGKFRQEAIGLLNFKARFPLPAELKARKVCYEDVWLDGDTVRPKERAYLIGLGTAAE